MKKRTLSIVQLILYAFCFASCFLKVFVYSSYKVWMYFGDVDKVEDKYYNYFTSLHWMKSAVPIFLFILIDVCFVLLVCCSVIDLLDKKYLSPFVLKIVGSRRVKTVLWILSAVEIILLSIYMLCWKALETILTGINDYWMLDQSFDIKRFAFLPFLFLAAALLFSDAYHNINIRLYSDPLANQKRIISLLFRGLGTVSVLAGFIIHLTDHFTTSAILYIISPVLITTGRLIAGLYEENVASVPDGETIMEATMQSVVSTATADVEIDTQTSAPASESNVNAIREYKELLDDGIISQEEFETKKKQLLGI